MPPCVYLNGYVSPFQRTAVPNSTAVLALDNLQVLRETYARYVAVFPYSTDTVYLCTVKRVGRGTGSPFGFVDNKGRYVPDVVYAVITPESWAAGIAAGNLYGFTSQEYMQFLNGETSPIKDSETTGENRPDWQYYPTGQGGDNVHTFQVIVHRDRDDVPDSA